MFFATAQRSTHGAYVASHQKHPGVIPNLTCVAKVGNRSVVPWSISRSNLWAIDRQGGLRPLELVDGHACRLERRMYRLTLDYNMENLGC
jgi:hypothetical protein